MGKVTLLTDGEEFHDLGGGVPSSFGIHDRVAPSKDFYHPVCRLAFHRFCRPRTLKERTVINDGFNAS